MIWLIAPVGAAVIGVGALISTLTKTKKKKFAKAMEYLRTRNFDKAADIFREILDEDPEDENAMWYLASIYEEKGDWDNAAQMFQMMYDTKIFPEDVSLSEVHRRLARAYFNAGKIVQAFLEFKKIYYADPMDPWAPFYLGRMYASQELFDEAIDYFRKSVSRKPSHSEAYFYMGLCYANKGEWTEAVEALEKAVRYAPTNFVYKYYYGVALKMSGSLDKAAEVLSSFAFGVGDSKIKVNSLDALGMTNIERNRATLAVPALESGLKALTRDLYEFYPDFLYNLGVANALIRDFAKAVAFFKKVIEVDPSYRQVSKMPRTVEDFDVDLTLKIYKQTIEESPLDLTGEEHLFIFPRVDLKALEEALRQKLAEEKRGQRGAESSVSRDVMERFFNLSVSQFRDLARKLTQYLGYNFKRFLEPKGHVNPSEEVDILAETRKRNSVVIGLRRWRTGQVGEMPLREFMATLEAVKAKKGIFISPIPFSSGARSLASSSGMIELIPPERLFVILSKILK